MNKCIVLILLIISSCCTQNVRNDNVVNPGYAGSTIPFDIEKGSNKLRLDDLNGAILLYLFVTDKGELEDFNIMRLRLKENENDFVITYNNLVYKPVSIEDYPENIREFYEPVNSYLSTLKFRKKVGEKVTKVNKFYLSLKVGDE